MKFSCLILGFCLTVFCGCSGLFWEPIYPSAQITKIFNVTDTSAQINVQVTSQSNSSDNYGTNYLHLQVFLGPAVQNTILQDNYLAEDPLPASITVRISRLSSHTEYTIQLFYSGYFIGDGGDGELSSSIGSPRTFTTN